MPFKYEGREEKNEPKESKAKEKAEHKKPAAKGKGKHKSTKTVMSHGHN